MEPSSVWTLGPWAFRGTTLLWTWIVMAVIVVFFFITSRSTTTGKPGRLQNLVEFIFDFVNDFLSERLEDPEKRRRLFYLLVAVFVFVLASNLIGLFALFRSPTSDANTTLALAGIVFILIHAYGVRYRGGGGHAMSFFKPYIPLMPFAVLEAITNPVTLALRLFGNIFAGDVILGLGTSAAPVALWGLGAIAMFLGSIVIQLLAISFNTFVDLIQAFIFMVLTLTYVAGSMDAVEEA